MAFESDSKIQGVFIKNQTLILDPDIQHDLNLKGYGEMKENKLILKPFESLYLLHIGKLVIFKGKKNLNFDFLLEIYRQLDENILTNFLIYRDLRTRGYTV